MTKRKVLSERELKERAIKRMMQNPRTNPESTYNRTYLVTGHIGGRCFVYYHGNNINIAKDIAWMRTRKSILKRPGIKTIPAICKIWTLRTLHVQKIEA